MDFISEIMKQAMFLQAKNCSLCSHGLLGILPKPLKYGKTKKENTRIKGYSGKRENDGGRIPDNIPKCKYAGNYDSRLYKEKGNGKNTAKKKNIA